MRRLLVAAAGALVVTAGVAVAIAYPKPAPKPHAGLVVRDGDQVRATGQVAGSAHGLQLCTRVGWGSFEARPVVPKAVPRIDCGNHHVADLTGLRAYGLSVGLPGGKPLPDPTPLMAVTVTGAYRHGTIDVRTVAKAVFAVDPLGITPPSPCRTYGKMGNPQPVSDYLAAHRDVIGAYWIAYRPGSGSAGPAVVNVGTTGSVAQLRSTLRLVYRGPLCVYHVPRSFRQLAPVVRQVQSLMGGDLVSASLGPDEAGLDYVPNRVIVEAKVITPSSAAKLRPLRDLIDVHVIVTPR